MNLVPRFLRKDTGVSIDTVIRRLEAANAALSGVSVTPESCMESPTVRAIVTNISYRIAVSPVRVMQKNNSEGRERKELLPNHPVARLLSRPNKWQSRSNYWMDSVSSVLRHGGYVALKGQGKTGPIRRLVPFMHGNVEIEQDPKTYDVTFKVHMEGGGFETFNSDQVHYVRLGARDFVRGDSPINDVKEAIALEIAAERYGASFFGNGAMPLIYFKLMEGFKGFRTEKEEEDFINSFQDKFSGSKRFRAMLLPKGMDLGDVNVENDKAQFIETRKLARNIIAGAFGVPPHIAGDLERATFNNVEQQDSDFVINAVMPIAKVFEDAMERDLLTDQDRRNGIIIRFNLDAMHRADFKTRQEALWQQRQAGVISANDWRERENMNPISEDDGGEDYWRAGNMEIAGQPAAEPANEE